MTWPTDESGRWYAPMPLVALRCPICGDDLYWRNHGKSGSAFRVRCQSYEKGQYGHGEWCGWAGTGAYRHGHEVYAVEPVQTALDSQWLAEKAHREAEARRPKVARLTQEGPR